MNMTENLSKSCRDRGLGTDDLLKYDVVPSSMLFDGDMFMNKHEKSQLIRDLEDKLKPDDYIPIITSLSRLFFIDIMTAVRRGPLTIVLHISLFCFQS